MGEDFQKRFFSLSIIGLTSKPLSLAVIEDLAQVVLPSNGFSHSAKNLQSLLTTVSCHALNWERGGGAFLSIKNSMIWVEKFLVSR